PTHPPNSHGPSRATHLWVSLVADSTSDLVGAAYYPGTGMGRPWVRMPGHGMLCHVPLSHGYAMTSRIGLVSGHLTSCQSLQQACTAREPAELRQGNVRRGDESYKLGHLVFESPELAQTAVDGVLELERCCNTGHQLRLVHRFREKIVSARLNAGDAIGLGIQRRHDDNGDEPRLFLVFEEPTDREAVHYRHHHVQQNQIRRFGSHFLEGLLAVRRTDGLVPEICQLLLSIIHIERLIGDNQNGGAYRSTRRG